MRPGKGGASSRRGSLLNDELILPCPARLFPFARQWSFAMPCYTVVALGCCTRRLGIVAYAWLATFTRRLFSNPTYFSTSARGSLPLIVRARRFAPRPAPIARPAFPFPARTPDLISAPSTAPPARSAPISPPPCSTSSSPSSRVTSHRQRTRRSSAGGRCVRGVDFGERVCCVLLRVGWGAGARGRAGGRERKGTE